jgi:hypothetical protein
MEKGSRWTAPTATQSANFLSAGQRIVRNAHFTGVSAWKTTTMRRTNRLQIRSIRALSAPFLQALIVEWLFPMHIDKVLARLKRSVLLPTALIKSHSERSGESFCVATLRCNVGSHRHFGSRPVGWPTEQKQFSRRDAPCHVSDD